MRTDYARLRRRGVSAADAAFLAKLGQDLRSIYADVFAQPVPDGLARMVDRFGEGEPPLGRRPRA